MVSNAHQKEQGVVWWVQGQNFGKMPDFMNHVVIGLEIENLIPLNFNGGI